MSPAKRRRASRGSGEQLRAEIVVAAKKLLAETRNADGVSIRAVADAVGVTSPSIYLHFADKDELINAVVLDVFAELDSAILEAAEGIDEPLDRLLAYGLAYVRFALAHPEHYRLATMEPCTDPAAVDEALAGSAFAHLHEAVRDCMDAGVFAQGETLPIALDLWSAAHGVAALIIAKPYLPWGDTGEVARRMLCAIALGHGTADLVGPEPTTAAMTTWLTAQRARRPRRSRQH